MDDDPSSPAGAAPGEAGGRLLVSDLDDTLTGDDEALARLVQRVGSIGRLRVAINSSRPLASVEATLATFPFDWRPDAIITALGTEIQLGEQPDADWAGRFHRWDRAGVDGVMAELGCRPHDPALQTRFKASFAVPPATQPQARRAIAESGLACRIIVSGGAGGEAFDVIPPEAGKGAATRYLARLWGVDEASGLIVAGDSENDQALFDVASRGIVVGNGRAELKAAVDTARVYFADQPHAAGVLEGLAAWGLFNERASQG